MSHIKKFNDFLNETFDTIYYTTSFPMSISKIIEIEVEERDNYEMSQVESWIEKYHIEEDDKLIWVATEPYIAARYQMSSDDWDRAEKIYKKNPGDFNVRTISSKEGVIIQESDDGDDGFLFKLF